MFFGFCSQVFEAARRLSALSVTRRIFVFSAASCDRFCGRYTCLVLIFLPFFDKTKLP